MTGNGDILVVDDTHDSLKLLTIILAGEGYVVRQAVSGELALAAVAGKAPELILLDIRMPGIDGFEVLQRLKDDPASGRIPVIILSAIAETPDRVKGLKLGAVDFISKPFQRDELLAKVRTHTELSRLRKKMEQQALELSADRDRLSALLAEARQTEEARREVESRFQTMFQGAPLGIALIDSDTGHFYEVNPRFAEIAGRSREEMKTIDWMSITHPDDVQKDLEQMGRLNSGEIPDYKMDKRYLRPDGSIVWIGMSIKPIKDPEAPHKRHLCMIEDITERKRADAECELLKTATEQVGEVIVITDPGGAIQYVNPAFEELTGYSREEVVGKNPRVLNSAKQDEAFYKELWKTISSGNTWEGRFINKRKNGKLYTEEASISPVRDAAGKIVNYVAVKRDITEQLQLESKFRQAQKMETVGQLAGGVAHDFNNILSSIMCYAGFIAKALAPGDPNLKDVKGIITSAERAAALTSQLLAFSRRQILAPKVVDLNRLTGGMTRMLRRVIGEEIKLEVKLQSTACTVNVDSGQIEQVIMNLALNARDAMQGGGTLTIGTEIINPPEEFFDARQELPIGPLVCLTVRDTGCGMDKEVKSHLFEPFFTTKEQGKGTGLGLSTVFGIVKQSHGEIEVESEPGKGSVFTVYLPLVETGRQDKDADRGPGPQVKGHETVLFVEDEESLRRLGERVLRSAGYAVLIAEDGQAALKLMEGLGKPVDLLMTDVVMPGMSGRELGRELARRNLAGRALYMSGYTDDAIVKHGVLEPGIAFIYKPFTVDGVLAKVREVLDGPAEHAKI